jgi:predicted branched-subunit amino acid permease
MVRESVKPIWRHPEFRAGIADVFPVSFGIAAWGVMTGVAMVNSGMHLVEVLLMAIVVFAGSSQLAALPLIASGAPVWVIVATAFCVNLRFIVFSIHLRPYVIHQSFWRRVFNGYLIADLSYVLLVRRYPHAPTDPDQVKSLEAYWAGNGWTAWMSWTVSGLVGVALGNRVPQSWGLTFAGILALVGVTASLVSTRLRVVSAAVAAGAAVVAVALPLKLNILVAIVVAVVVCLAVESRTPASIETA